jgi:acetyl/propionyl-CoA carboxylase alpha subunit
MVAKILAHGPTAPPRSAGCDGRSRRPPCWSTGGTTNRAFLLDLLQDDDVLAGRIDTGWLDRRTADGGYRFTTRTDVALVAAAIDAYDEASAVDRGRFFASAARGRPHLDPELPRVVDLRADGVAYRLEVSCTGPGRYLVATDGVRVLAEVEPLRRHERRLTVEGQRFRVVAIRQGADSSSRSTGSRTASPRTTPGCCGPRAPRWSSPSRSRPGETVAAGRRSPCSRA